ncbi:MAG: arginine--tRNA ligase [Thermoplasmatota archaeon]
MTMTYPFQRFRRQVAEQLAEMARERYGYTGHVRLEEPAEAEMGDVAFPCFPLAGQAKKAPAAVAEELAAGVSGEWIGHVEAVNGYVNCFIDEQRLAAELPPQVLEMGERYGAGSDKGESVIVEHTSANPNGPLHVGRGRNPMLGDTLARIFRYAGYDVETQFYLDDMGKQVAILAWGLEHLDLAPDAEKPDHRSVIFYQEANRRMEEDTQVSEAIEELIRRCEQGDMETLEHMEQAYRPVLDGVMQTLGRINISIDSYVRESRFVLDGTVSDVVARLSETAYADREDDALYLDLSSFDIHGRNQKFYLTRRDGTSLYATRDVAYHLWKGRQADRLVNVLGEDHRLEARQVEIALSLLDAPAPTSVFYSFVSMPEGKMSTRRGRVVYLDDLLDEAVERAYREVQKRRDLPEEQARAIAEKVGTGAVRYNILKVSPEKAITFQWEEALNFEGQSAPFLQYAYARCCSILDKAGTSQDMKKSSPVFGHEQEIALLKTIARLPDVVEQCRERYSPAGLAEYAHELASRFNGFYRDCRVVGDENEAARLTLVEATRVTLHNVLGLLGISPLPEM